MGNIDNIFKSMDTEKRTRLKEYINEYRKSGDVSAKSAVLSILRDFDDTDAIRKFLRES